MTSSNLEDMFSSATADDFPPCGIPGRLWFNKTKRQMWLDRGTHWEVVEDEGIVHGPGGVEDGHLVIFDGTSGQLLKDGGTVHPPVTVQDSDTVHLTLTEQQIHAGVIPGGIQIEDLSSSDSTTGNATPEKHGLLPELPSIVTGSEFLAADGTWKTPDTGAHNFVQLGDTPKSYGEAGQLVVVNSSGSGLAFVDPPSANGHTIQDNIGDDMPPEPKLHFRGLVVTDDSSSGATVVTAQAPHFLQLPDAPSDYTGQAGKVVAVKPDATGLEFVPPSSGGADLTVENPTGTAMTQRDTLQFAGSVVVTDDATHGRTVIEVVGGGGGFGGSFTNPMTEVGDMIYCPSVGRNVATAEMGARASASSYHNSGGWTGVPENAMDGNINTWWCSQNNGAGEWLQIDLGQERSITEFRISQYANEGGIYASGNILLQFSHDGTTFSPAYTISGTQTTYDIYLAVPISARYWRAVTQDTTSSHYWFVTEFILIQGTEAALHIGQEDQVLAVKNGLPTWENFNREGAASESYSVFLENDLSMTSLVRYDVLSISLTPGKWQLTGNLVIRAGNNATTYGITIWDGTNIVGETGGVVNAHWAEPFHVDGIVSISENTIFKLAVQANDTGETILSDTLYGGVNKAASFHAVRLAVISMANTVTLAEDYILIRDKKSLGEPGGTPVARTWITRALTEKKSDSGNHATLDNNQITLEAGTYKVHISCPAYQADSHQIVLFNVTSGTVLLWGTPAFSYHVQNIQTSSIIDDEIVLSVSTVLEIQHQVGAATGGVNGLGVAAGLGDEIYTIAEFLKEVPANVRTDFTPGSSYETQAFVGSVIDTKYGDGASNTLDFLAVPSGYDYLELQFEGNGSSFSGMCVFFNGDTTQSHYVTSYHGGGNGHSSATSGGYSYFSMLPDSNSMGLITGKLARYDNDIDEKMISIRANEASSGGSIIHDFITVWNGSRSPITRITLMADTPGVFFSARATCKLVGYKDRVIGSTGANPVAVTKETVSISGTNHTFVTDAQGASGEVLYGKKLVYDETLASAGSFSISNIPQGYDHLEIIAQLVNANGDPAWVSMFANGDMDASHYHYATVGYDSASVFSQHGAQPYFSVTSGNGSSGTYGIATLFIPGYSGTNKKSATILTGAKRTDTPASIQSLLYFWDCADPITQLLLDNGSVHFGAGSRVQVFATGQMTTQAGVSSAYVGQVIGSEISDGTLVLFDKTINASYDEIRILIDGSSSGADSLLQIALNGDTNGTAYTRDVWYAVGSGGNTHAADNSRYIGQVFSGGNQAQIRHTLSRPSVVGPKMITNDVGLSNGSANYISTQALTWSSTDPVTRITITSDIALSEGSRITLIGYRNTLLSGGGAVDGNGVLEIPYGIPPSLPKTGKVLLYADVIQSTTTAAPSDPAGSVFCSSQYSSYPAYLAFQHNAGSGWLTNGSSTGYIGYQFPAAKVINSYSIKPWFFDSFFLLDPLANGPLMGQTMEPPGQALDTRTGIDFPTATDWYTYTFTNTASYIYYRVNITANHGGNYVGLGGIEMFEPSTTVGLFVMDSTGAIKIVH